MQEAVLVVGVRDRLYAVSMEWCRDRVQSGWSMDLLSGSDSTSLLIHYRPPFTLPHPDTVYSLLVVTDGVHDGVYYIGAGSAFLSWCSDMEEERAVMWMMRHGFEKTGTVLPETVEGGVG